MEDKVFSPKSVVSVKFRSIMNTLVKRLLPAAVSALLTFTVLPSYGSTHLSCSQGGECKLGDIGPGGGVVFYVSSTLQSWGRYIEVAPNNWYRGRPDPSTQPFCGGVPANGISHKPTSSQIGQGKANTDFFLSFPNNYCTTGAPAMARQYSSNGLSDWSLPSKDELDEIVYEASKYGVRLNSGTPHYWSSTSNGYSITSLYVPFSTWGNQDSSANNHVRPVRHFMTTLDKQNSPTQTTPKVDPGIRNLIPIPGGIADIVKELNSINDKTIVVINKRKTIVCTKGKITKRVTALKPKCPTGYKKR